MDCIVSSIEIHIPRFGVVCFVHGSSPSQEPELLGAGRRSDVVTTLRLGAFFFFFESSRQRSRLLWR
jgi:hypothetical protein